MGSSSRHTDHYWRRTESQGNQVTQIPLKVVGQVPGPGAIQ